METASRRPSWSVTVKLWYTTKTHVKAPPSLLLLTSTLNVHHQLVPQSSLIVSSLRLNVRRHWDKPEGARHWSSRGKWCHLHTETPESIIRLKVMVTSESGWQICCRQRANMYVGSVLVYGACCSQTDSRPVLDWHGCVIHDKNLTALEGLKSFLSCLFWQHTGLNEGIM